MSSIRPTEPIGVEGKKASAGPADPGPGVQPAQAGNGGYSSPEAFWKRCSISTCLPGICPSCLHRPSGLRAHPGGNGWTGSHATRDPAWLAARRGHGLGRDPPGARHDCIMVRGKWQAWGQGLNGTGENGAGLPCVCPGWMTGVVHPVTYAGVCLGECSELAGRDGQ
jgi:hypothetical protein